MHYFHKLSSASGAVPPDPTGAPDLDCTWDFRLQTPTPGKNPAGAYVQWIGFSETFQKYLGMLVGTAEKVFKVKGQGRGQTN